MMLTVPKFRPGTRLEFVEPDCLFILTETSRFIRIDSLLYRLARLIDGRRSTDEIVELVRATASLPEIYFHLIELNSHGLIVESGETRPLGESAPAEQSFCPSITVLGPAFADVAAVQGILSANGIETSDVHGAQTAASQLTLVLTDDYLNAELREINRRMLGSRRKWLLAKVTGSTAWIGPQFVPEVSACWECLAERLRGHRHVDGYLESIGRAPVLVNDTASESVRHAFQHILVDRAIRAAHDPALLQGQVITIDAANMATRQHVLSRQPHCVACGDPDHRRRLGPRPIELHSRPVRQGSTSGCRTVSPEDTLKRLESLVSPITGIVSDIRRIDVVSEASLPPVYSLPHIFVRKYHDVDMLIHTLQNSCGGKGRSDMEARVSGLCEAVERYSGLFHGDEIIRRARCADLDVPFLHPKELMQFSTDQYAQRESWNARFGHHQFIPMEFDEHAELAWTPAWSLRDQRTIWVPTAYAYYGYATIDCRSIYADSNGCAAGNTLEEAILQGFFERVERDAVAIWWYNHLRRPGVELTSFQDPFINEVSGTYDRLERDVWALDLTNDLGIPAFAALSRKRAETEDIIFGFGAHFDARIALSRAMTELHQCLPCVHGRLPDGATDYRYPSRDAVKWWKEARLQAHDYLLPSDTEKPRLAAQYPRAIATDVGAEVRQCVRIAAEHGLDTVVLDQTRPEIGFPVARVIVPQLRHFWARFAPGRLYDVPVKLGWRSAPTPEAYLNPFPMFL